MFDQHRCKQKSESCSTKRPVYCTGMFVRKCVWSPSIINVFENNTATTRIFSVKCNNNNYNIRYKSRSTNLCVTNQNCHLPPLKLLSKDGKQNFE